MELSDFKVSELRDAARQVVPESRGTGGLAHVGSKSELVALLQQKGIMPGEVKEILEGNKALKAPQEVKEGVGGGFVQVQPATEEGKAPEPVETELPKFSVTEVSRNDETGEVEYKVEECKSQKDKATQGMGGMQGDDSTDELEIVRSIITKNVAKTMAQMMGSQKPEIDEEKVGAIVDAKLAELKDHMVKTIEVKQPDGSLKPVGIAHFMTERIAQVCNLGIHQMLVGPAGGGKTTCAEKVAEILNLKFYPVSVGPQTTKSDLLGFVDAAGNYHSTPLRDSFENGGLLLLDEVDAANAGVLTIINSLLANGYCAFPDKIVQKHENFRCICACNTYGRGADRQYVGRNQLDAATLDRFAVVDFEYDEDMERAIAGNNTWVKKVQNWRKKAFELKMRVVISPRASIFGAKLIAAGIPEREVENLVVWKGIAEDMRVKIRGN